MKKIFIFFILGALTLFCLAACGSKHSHPAGRAVHWGYSGKSGPVYWGKLSKEFSACKKGKSQTPIDIQRAKHGDSEKFYFDYNSKSYEILNNGHTIKVNYQSRSVIVVGDEQFALKQFHFHSPSENHIKGRSFPMEAHFVHADIQGNLAVVSVMYAVGKANPEIEKLWRQMPKKKGDRYKLNSSVDALDLFPENKEYYRFNGSLTTPPCSEGVSWIVFKTPVTVSKEQLKKFRKVMPRNNRPIQRLNKRVILKGAL